MPVSEQTGEKMVPVLYVDLDGTIRWGADEMEGRFVNGPGDVRVFDGVADLLGEYKELGWRIVGVSNQGGIALGYMTKEDNMAAMVETARQCNNVFSKITWCSHHPNAESIEMAHCWCRKPRPGLVIEAALDLSGLTKELYPPYLSLFVGDRPEDEQCAEAANVPFLGAAEWRKGHHLAGLKDRAEHRARQDKAKRG